MAVVARVYAETDHGRLPSVGKPIDLVHLAKQSLGDPGLEEEILRMFDQLVRTYMGRVRAAPAQKDLVLNLHSLKGAALGVGANAVAELARTAEDELLEKGCIDLERIADLSLAVEEVRAFIAELLDS